MDPEKTLNDFSKINEIFDKKLKKELKELKDNSIDRKYDEKLTKSVE